MNGKKNLNSLYVIYVNALKLFRQKIVQIRMSGEEIFVQVTFDAYNS